MSRLREGEGKQALLRFFTAALMAMGLSLPLLHALLPEQLPLPACLICMGAVLLFQGLFALRIKGKAWIMGAAAGGLLLWGFLGGGPVFQAAQWMKAAFLTFRGVPDALLPYGGAARWTVCLVFAFLSAALAREDAFPFALLLTSVVAGLSFLMGRGEGELLYILPAAAGLLLMMNGASGQSRRLSALPVALLIALLAFFMVPSAPKTDPALEKAAQTVRQFVEDYLLFNEYRSSFSLTAEGYQPEESRLGGPALPENHSVMEVETDGAVLLRGRAYNEYTGLNWFDTLSYRRYLYASPRFAGLRDELFDAARPLAGPRPEPVTLRIHMLDQGTTTLFTPVKTENITMESDRMVLYYNMASERFLTRELLPGDTYTLTYLPYAPDDPLTQQAIRASAAMADPHMADVEAQYLALPPHIQKEIFEIAEKAAQGKNTPFEKALAVRDYLRDHYSYNLAVPMPPENVDFTAWFLIGAKEGYCTYFASAMTVLCRTLGIPARYVTGYLALPNEDGIALVTGKMAHAWTEIYLNGFGWLPMDATPRQDYQQGGEGDEAPNALPTPTPTPTPTPLPSPTPSPAPSQPPEDKEGPPDEATPTPPPPEEEKAPTPTPLPSDDPEGESGQPPENPKKPEKPFPWLWLLMILLIIAAAVFQYLRTQPERRAARKPERAADIYFDALCGAMALCQLQRRAEETWLEFSSRADAAAAGRNLPPVSGLINGYAAKVYGRHPADPQPLKAGYHDWLQSLNPWQKLRLLIQRMGQIRLPENRREKPQRKKK